MQQCYAVQGFPCTFFRNPARPFNTGLCGLLLFGVVALVATTVRLPVQQQKPFSDQPHTRHCAGYEFRSSR